MKPGCNSTFRATGQTGIMLAGEGIAIDAVVADFVAGAAELISPDNDENHWDVIEGQGSLFHPGYSGVSLGLLHGSQPDAFVLCHDATRTAVSGWEHYPLPSIREAIDLHTLLGRRTNPDIRCVGISVNTSKLAADKRLDYLAALSRETGLPCVDPIIDGCGAIVEHIKQLLCGEINMDFSLHISDWVLTQPFRISGFEWINSRCLVVQLGKDGVIGRGEAQGVFYLDETAESIFEQAHAVAAEIRKGISRDRSAATPARRWRPQRHRLRPVGPRVQTGRQDHLATHRY